MPSIPRKKFSKLAVAATGPGDAKAKDAAETEGLPPPIPTRANLPDVVPSSADESARKPQLPYRRPRISSGPGIGCKEHTTDTAHLRDAVVYTGMRPLGQAVVLAGFSSETLPKGLILHKSSGALSIFSIQSGRLVLHDASTGKLLPVSFLNGCSLNGAVSFREGLVAVADGARKLIRVQLPTAFCEGSARLIPTTLKASTLAMPRILERPGRREFWITSGTSTASGLITLMYNGQDEFAAMQETCDSPVFAKPTVFLNEQEIAVLDTDQIQVFRLVDGQPGSSGMTLLAKLQLSATETPLIKIHRHRPNELLTIHADGKMCRWIFDAASGSLVRQVNVTLTRYKVTAAHVVSHKDRHYFWIGLQVGKCLVVSIEDDDSVRLLAEARGSHDAPISSFLTLPGDQRTIWSLCQNGRLVSWDASLALYHFNRSLWMRRPEFAAKLPVQIRMCSWNVAAQMPAAERSDQAWSDWLGLSSEEQPDMLIVGLQEMQDLKSTSTRAGLLEEWASCVLKRLDASLSAPASNWTMLHSTSLVGLGLLVFAKGAIAKALSAVHGTSVKTGFGGLHGNKGALVVRLIVGSTPIALVAAHLSAGHKALNERNSDFGTILRTADLPKASLSPLAWSLFPSGNGGERIMDQEAVFFMGDLNYRIEMERGRCERMIRQNQLSELFGSDQLAEQLRRSDLIASAFQEAQDQPSFPPTYKYDMGTVDSFDSSEKQRIPAWCDRILHYASPYTELRCTGYGSVQMATASDHKPIFASYTLTAWVIDPERQAQLMTRLLMDPDELMQLLRSAGPGFWS